MIQKIRDFVSFMYSIGYFAEFFSICMVTFLLWSRWCDLWIYGLGLLANRLVNMVFKHVVDNPRPQNPVKFLESEHFTKGRNVNGMPSGHTQNVFFAMTYLFFVYGHAQSWILAASLIALLTIVERYLFHNHTIPQLLVGSMVGIGMGFLFVHLRKENLCLKIT